MLAFNGNAQTEIKPSEYGFYHNEVLSEFTKKYGENQNDVNFILDKSIELMKIKHPELFKDVDASEIKKLFVVKSTSDFDYKKIWNSNIEKYYNDETNPKIIVDLVTFIVNEDSTYDQAIRKLDDFEASNKLTTNELNSLTAVKSVLVSSNEYWNAGFASRHRPGSKTLVADFAGLAMFGWGGPVACIASFAMSYITYQNDY